MDPNTPQPQGGNPNLQKLENDLQNLTAQAQEQAPVATAAPVAATSETPVPEQPAVKSEIPTVPPQPEGKKNSPLVVIALILLVIAIFAIGAYILFSGVLTQNPVSTPTQTQAPLVTLSPSPVATTSATPSASPTATASSSGTPTAKPTGSGTPAPTIPGY